MAVTMLGSDTGTKYVNLRSVPQKDSTKYQRVEGKVWVWQTKHHYHEKKKNWTSKDGERRNWAAKDKRRYDRGVNAIKQHPSTTKLSAIIGWM